MLRALALTIALGLSLPAAAAEPDAESTYRLATDGSTTSVKVGEKGNLVVRFEPVAAGIHVDPKAPLHIRVETSAGLRADKGELRRADAVDPGAPNPRFDVSVRGVLAGAQEATLALDFFVCSDSWCARQKRVLRFPVAVR